MWIDRDEILTVQFVTNMRVRYHVSQIKYLFYLKNLNLLVIYSLVLLQILNANLIKYLIQLTDVWEIHYTLNKKIFSVWWFFTTWEWKKNYSSNLTVLHTVKIIKEKVNFSDISHRGWTTLRFVKNRHFSTKHLKSDFSLKFRNILLPHL